MHRCNGPQLRAHNDLESYSCMTETLSLRCPSPKKCCIINHQLLLRAMALGIMNYVAQVYSQYSLVYTMLHYLSVVLWLMPLASQYLLLVLCNVQA